MGSDMHYSSFIFLMQVAYRKSGIDVDYRHFDEGAFIYYVPKTKPLKKVPAANWGVSVARLLSDTRVLDVLLNNSDRHSGHFLYGEHWADAKMCPVLIDHAAGFRKVGDATRLLLFAFCFEFYFGQARWTVRGALIDSRMRKVLKDHVSELRDE
jgi:hypothetical protein